MKVLHAIGWFSGSLVMVSSAMDSSGCNGARGAGRKPLWARRNMRQLTVEVPVNAADYEVLPDWGSIVDMPEQKVRGFAPAIPGFRAKEQETQSLMVRSQ
jgi:hypothetical protein